MIITVRPVVRKIGRNSASFQGGMSPTHIGSLLQTASRSEETDIGKKKETANSKQTKNVGVERYVLCVYG